MILIHPKEEEEFYNAINAKNVKIGGQGIVKCKNCKTEPILDVSETNDFVRDCRIFLIKIHCSKCSRKVRHVEEITEMEKTLPNGYALLTLKFLIDKWKLLNT